MQAWWTQDNSLLIVCIRPYHSKTKCFIKQKLVVCDVTKVRACVRACARLQLAASASAMAADPVTASISCWSAGLIQCIRSSAGDCTRPSAPITRLTESGLKRVHEWKLKRFNHGCVRLSQSKRARAGAVKPLHVPLLRHGALYHLSDESERAAR